LTGNYAFLYADKIPRLAYIVASSVVTLFVNFVVVTCYRTSTNLCSYEFTSTEIGVSIR